MDSFAMLFVWCWIGGWLKRDGWVDFPELACCTLGLAPIMDPFFLRLVSLLPGWSLDPLTFIFNVDIRISLPSIRVQKSDMDR